MSGTSTHHRPRVVVVGGSFSGLCTLRHLRHHADVILVEPRDYFEYTPGACHLLTGSKAYSSLLSPIAQVTMGVKKNERGWFVGFKPETKRVLVRRVDTETGGASNDVVEVPYDVLVLCSGQPYNAPIRASSVEGGSYFGRVAELKAFHKRLEGADSILVTGGGLVGVELAAELAVRLKHKPNVSLVSRSELLNTLPAAAGKYALDWLVKRKVNVVLNDELAAASGGGDNNDIVTTKRGQKIKASVVIDCTGNFSPYPLPQGAVRTTTATATATPQAVPASSSSSSSSTTSASAASAAAADTVVWPFTSKGLVRVNKHLEAIDFTNQGIFAAGDVVEFADGSGVGFACSTAKGGPFGTTSLMPTVRNAHLAESQAELVAANVRRYLLLEKNSYSSGDGEGNQQNQKKNSNSEQRLFASVPPRYLAYPKDVFGANLNPLLACVSLGPHNGIVVFNDLVIGGFGLSILAGVVKFIIERSKISEIRGEVWGSAFWAFGHVVVNHIHSFLVYILSFWGGQKRKAFKPNNA